MYPLENSGIFINLHFVYLLSIFRFHFLSLFKNMHAYNMLSFLRCFSHNLLIVAMLKQNAMLLFTLSSSVAYTLNLFLVLSFIFAICFHLFGFLFFFFFTLFLRDLLFFPSLIKNSIKDLKT